MHGNGQPPFTIIAGTAAIRASATGAGVPARDVARGGMATPPSRSPIAGGVLIALGAVGGAIVGFIVRQPTECFLIGTAAGIGMAIAIWLIDRRR